MAEPTNEDREVARAFAALRTPPDATRAFAADCFAEGRANGRAEAIEELASEVECRSKAAYAKVRDFESGTLDEAAYVAAGLFLRELAEDLRSDKWQRHYYAKRRRRTIEANESEKVETDNG